MDGAERRLSQYGAPYQPAGAGRSAHNQPMGPSSQEQYSQTTSSPSRGEMSSQATARPYVPDYAFPYQQQQFQPQIQYPSAFLPDPPRSHHLQQPSNQQQYASYGHGNMLPPMQQSQVYEGISNYQQQQRQSAAIEVMASQFGGGSIPQYIHQSEQGSGVAIASSSQYMTSQPEQHQYGSMSYQRPHLQPPFAPSSEYSLIDQPSLSAQAQEEANTRQATEEGKRRYEAQLRVVFEAIIAGRVTEASEKLVGMTEWLFGSIRALGLHHDDEGSHEQRLRLWRELNHAWEALGMKQKTITETALRTRQRPPDLLSADAIRELMDKLVQLGDQIEKYGLVDYEMGLWEEQIVETFIECLDLLPREAARGDTFSS